MEQQPKESSSVSGKHSISIGGAVANSVIITGDANSNLVVGPEGDVIGRNVTVSSVSDKRVLPQDVAFERIGAAIRSNLLQLEQNVVQSRQESSQFFKLTLTPLKKGS
jgi:hypothetical protein